MATGRHAVAAAVKRRCVQRVADLPAIKWTRLDNFEAPGIAGLREIGLPDPFEGRDGHLEILAEVR